MTQPQQDLVIHAWRVPRAAPRRDAILRLIDGQRTALEIAAELGISIKHVRTIASKYRRSPMLRRASGVPIAAPFPPDLVLRDLSLPPAVARWLLDQTRNGALVQDVIRGVLTDACQEEEGP